MADGEITNTAKVIIICDESAPPPILRVMLDRTYNGYHYRLIVAADGTVAMGEPDDAAALGIAGEFRATHALPRAELLRWLRQAIVMLER